jgi:hypothetical protein
MATSKTELKVTVAADSSKVDLDPAKKSLQQVQKEAAAAKAGLASLLAEFQASKNAAVQSGVAYDKALGSEFQKKISQSRTEISKLNAEIAQGVAAGVGNAGVGVGKDADAFGGLSTSLKGLVSPLAAVGVAYAGLNQAFRISNLADSLGDISDATGNTVGSLRTLQTSLVEAGGDVADMEKFATKLAVSVGDAAEGNEKMIDVFRRLNVPIKDVNGEMRDQDAILQDVISALAKIENPAQRASLAVDLLGKTAAKLDFTKLSAIRDIKVEESVKNLNNLRGELEKLGNYVDGVLIGIFGALAKSINEAFPQTAVGKVERLKKVLAGLEAQNSLFSPRTSAAIVNVRKQLAEAEQELRDANELRLLAGKGSLGTNAKQAPIKDSQFGTAKKPPAPAPAARPEKVDKLSADLANKESEQQKQSLNEFNFYSQEYKRLYAENLVSIQAYYDQQQLLIDQQRVADQEAFVARQEQLKTEKARLETGVAQGKADPKEVLKVETEIQRSITENQAKQLGYVTQKRTLESQQTKDSKAYEASMRSITTEYLNQTGLASSIESVEARRLSIQERYATQLAQATKEENAVAIARIESLKQFEEATAQLAARQAEVKQSLVANDVQQLDIQRQQQQGLISNIQAEERLLDLKRQQVESQLAFNEAALATGQIDGLGLSPEKIRDLQNNTAKLKVELATLKPVVVDIGTQFSNAFQNKIGSALGDVVTGTKTVRQAFGDMLKDISSQLIRSSINDLIKKTFGGGTSSGGSGNFFSTLLSGLFSGGVVAKAEGGYVRGPGSTTSDSIPALLSDQEYVIKASAVKQLGVPLLDALNQGLAPAVRAFRNGGPVTRSPVVPQKFANGGMVSPPASANGNGDITIINNSSVPVQARREVDPKTQALSIFLEDLQRGGKASKAISQAFGIPRAAT